jgi:FkbM family methyltransferase
MQRQIQLLLRHRLPPLWHAYSYRRYLRAGYGVREIHFLPDVTPPERYAVDVGVFEGIYARCLAGLCRGVVGFEANPDSAAFCRAVLGKMATIYNCALSDRLGVATLRVPDVSAQTAAVDALATVAPSNDLCGLASREIAVRSARLDDFELPPVGFIKIDVEGHEEAVLKGAEATIARDRPSLMIEIEESHNKGALGRIFDKLGKQGFRVRCVLDGELRDAPSVDDLAHRRPEDGDYVRNFFFIPEENVTQG